MVHKAARAADDGVYMPRLCNIGVGVQKYDLKPLLLLQTITFCSSRQVYFVCLLAHSGPIEIHFVPP